MGYMIRTSPNVAARRIARSWVLKISGFFAKSLVTAKTAIGGMRVVDLPAGELLPRIC